MKAFHFLQLNMKAGSGNEPAWSIGEKRTLQGKIIACRFGYHASPTLYAALRYAPGPIACLVEIEDDSVSHGNPIDKYVSSSRVLINAINIEDKLRLYAADCAEHVLYLFEDKFPEDNRPRQAIKAIRDFVAGQITKEQLSDAAAAAYAATNAAAYAAANAADAYAYAAYAAAYAAVATAYAAAATAAAAAYAAANAADAYAYAANANATEKEWQLSRFEFYTKDLFAEI